MSKGSLDVDPNKSSWTLTVFIEELNIHHTINVSNSSIISSVVMDLINKVNLKYEWTEFWFWCPYQKVWLLPKNSSLSQFKIDSFREVHFTRRYNLVSIQLPDLQIRQIMLDFSKTIWQTNKILCKKFGIRHHEELSLQWRLLEKSMKGCESPDYLGNPDVTRTRTKRFVRHFFSNTSIDKSSKFKNSSQSPLASPVSFFSMPDNVSTPNDSIYFQSFENSKLSNSPKKSFNDAIKSNDIVQFKTYKDRSNLKFNWMVSELDLMEQLFGIYDRVILLLRYKYHNYYYLNEIYDEIRINQIYHQAYWSVVSGETDCSADEAYVLGGIAHQIDKCISNKSEMKLKKTATRNIDKEIDTMLDKLQLELIGRCEDKVESELVSVEGELYVLKYPKKFYTGYKKVSAILKQNGIHLYKFSKSKTTSKFLFRIPVIGNEIKIHVHLSSKEIYIIEIIMLKKNYYRSFENVKSKKLVEKFKLRFYYLSEFLRWGTSLRLLSKSIDFSLLSNYQYEYHIVHNIIELKRPQQNALLNNRSHEHINLNLNDLIGPKFNKTFKRKEIVDKILFHAAAFKHYNLLQAKLAYIKCWLTLYNAGLSYYQVRINKQKYFELIGIGYNRIIIVDIDLGNITQSIEMTHVLTLDTNWELFFSLLKLSDETIRIEFRNYGECQMFHEHFGGYLFIMLRNAERLLHSSEKIFRSMTARNILK